MRYPLHWMRAARWILLATSLAAALLTAAVGYASGNRLSVSNRNIRVVWSKINFTDAGRVTNLECDVTIEGSFHTNTITKTRGALIGYVSRAPQPQNCVGGGATLLQESLPWHIRYDSFTGSLPRVTGERLQIVLVAFRFNVGFECLYRSTAAEPMFGIANIEPNGLVTGLTLDNATTVPRAEGSIFCPASGRFENTGRVTLLGSTTNLSVRLI